MSNSIDRLLLNTDSHDHFLKSLMSSLVLSTKSTNGLPKGLDYSYNNTFDGYKRVHSDASNKIDRLIESILGFVRPESEIMDMCADVADPYFYDMLVETVDLLLSNADIVLNSSSLSATSTSDKIFSSLSTQSLLLNKDRIVQENVLDLAKPQLSFCVDIDNSRGSPFVPKIIEKYHKKTPYERKLMDASDISETDMATISFYYPHPYLYELQTLAYPSFLLSDPSNLKPQFPDPLRKFQYVDNQQQLFSLIRELALVQEFAIDLEHHSVRSFQGLTCLMQISSRTKDYVIDTLSLRMELYRLGEVFADPTKVKVFHGCDRDILWLQRDFGLYIVNCFDTFQAAKVLRFSALSLAHLVKFFCGVTLNKKYQLADWRVRPLPEDMLLYAKYDTHYLLYIYDSLRKELWKREGPEGIEKVLSSSKKLCMSRYEKDTFNPESYRSLLTKSGASKSIPNINDLSPYQQNALAKLWDWRDYHARQEDESCQYIMSNAELVRIGLKIPRYEKDVLSCSPLTEYVRSRLSDIVELMLSVEVSDNSHRSTDVNPTTPIVLLTKQDVQSVTNRSKQAIFSINPSMMASFAAKDEMEIVLNPASSQITIDELFRVAGWKTPLLTSENPREKNSYKCKLFGEQPKSSYFSVESKQKMNRSVEDLFESLDSTVNFEKRLLELVKAPEATVNEASQCVEYDEPDNVLICDIPKSFDDIYHLSSRNRKKNKEKKRNRDVDCSLENDTNQVSHAADLAFSNLERQATTFVTKDGFDYKKYFLEAPHELNADISVDGTLAFAKKLGWVKDDGEMESLRNEHMKILTYQQSVEDFSCPHEEKAGNGSDHRKIAELKPRMGAGFNQCNTNRNARVAVSQDSADMGKPSGKIISKSFPAPFDYSHVGQHSLGVLPGGDLVTRKYGGSTSGKGSIPKSKNSAVPHNPYLQTRK